MGRVSVVSVILAHPYEKSFNHALFEIVCDAMDKLNISVFSHDLYREQFDPVMTVSELRKIPSIDPKVKQHTEELMASDLICFIHPNWWGQPPAILKGYIDRVIRPPHAYDFPAGDTGGGVPMPGLTGKTGIVFNTSNTEAQREIEVFGDPLQRIWKDCIFGFCGIEKVYRRNYTVVADSTEEQRQVWLMDAQSIIRRAVGK